jgi:uncharacterized membrane protein YdjX (TVP38/TMEM64 family)
MIKTDQRRDGNMQDAPLLWARLRRFVPVAVVILAMAAVFCSGVYRQISLETLVQHRMAIDAFVAAHGVAAVVGFVAIYVTAVALSIPGASLLTMSSGILFGVVVGASASVVGATAGATLVFMIARSACGEALARRAGPLANKIACGFRANAFNYLLFLRLVPAFPFFLVNLAPALVGVKPSTFVAATAIGIVPATFAFAFLGAGLDSVLAAPGEIYRECLASGATDCQLHFSLGMIVTPQLICASVALGAIALIPVVVKRWRTRAATHPARLA